MSMLLVPSGPRGRLLAAALPPLLFTACGGAKGTVRFVNAQEVVGTVVGAPGRSGVRLGVDGRLLDPLGVAVPGPGRLAISTANGVVRAELP